MLNQDQPASAQLGNIRHLRASECYLLRDHFLRLDPEARRRRFGHDVTNDFIRSYASDAAEAGNITFGYFVDGDVRAAGELHPDALIHRDSAEVAFSVEQPFANRGIATQLMGCVIRTARNRGLRHLLLVCSPENAKMQAIARHYGAELKIDDGLIVADIVPQQAGDALWHPEICGRRAARF
jgi:RimJ/RimL family protein N-acetyltransferase